jgi:hypothetical protein
MQPYFFPYIGYFQLMSAVDVFVVYDNIKYTKKGWINRNRLLSNGMDAVFSLPLANASDQCQVFERSLAANYQADKILRQMTGAYQKAPFFSATQALVAKVCQYGDHNLFAFLNHGLQQTSQHLDIATRLIRSSDIDIDHNLKGQDKVLAICQALGADMYVNSIGGQSLYSKDAFRSRNVDLKFLQPKPLVYPQLGNSFVPWLSIIDALMFNPLHDVQSWVANHWEWV